MRLRIIIAPVLIGVAGMLGVVLKNGVGLGQTSINPPTAKFPAPPRPKNYADETARQVTVFAILATSDPSSIDPRLASVNGQLRKVLPGHGFKLLDVKSKRVQTAQSVVCDLGDHYQAETILVQPLDENGKVQLRCNLSREGVKEFSTLVKTPIDQLFFYERSLTNGTRVLIGIGARDAFSL
jgi:hypothetical protein